ncbi:hypothetical protein ACYSNO_00025 [Enterococcus sp. LJL98]
MNYRQATLESSITYGEILTTSIQPTMYQGKHVIILTNQRYYDRFFEKIQGVFSSVAMDWYVCRNQLYANTLEEWMSLLAYLEQFSRKKAYLLVAIGNAGVVELAGFLQKVSLLDSTFWAIPVSFQSYTQSLVPEKTIYRQPSRPILRQINLPEKIFLDQTMLGPKREGRLIDLQVFIRTAVVCDYQLLRRLFKEYPNQKQLQATNFTALIEELTSYYQMSVKTIESYGKVFEEAFYLTEGGHHLSENMKRFLGFLMHFIWNAFEETWTFNLENFLLWLNHLGFPIFFPEQISMAEYFQNVLQLVEGGTVVCLTRVGEKGPDKKVNEQSLINAFENYQKICREIKRENNDT